MVRMEVPVHTDRFASLDRLAALSLVAAGALSAVAGVFHPDDTIAGGVFQPAWRPVHYVQTIAFGLPAFGTLAIYLRARAGALATTMLVAGVLGAIGTAGLTLMEATLVPRVFSTLSPTPPLVAAMQPGGPLPEILPVLGVVLVGWLVATLLLAVVAWRSGVFPKAASVLLAVPALCQMAPLPGWLHAAAIVLHGVGLALLGAAALGLLGERATLAACSAGSPAVPSSI
jgi:hypothetical protein